MPEFSLSEQDLVDELERIVREGGNAAARIAAIKELRAIRGAEKPAVDEFAALDAAAKPNLRAV